MDKIDLRSDTVTWPTDEMREAMATAVVGDDVYGEDPTVIQLEADAAAMFGKEAGLFVTSGSQGNLAALLAHCERGSEVILGDKAHSVAFEAGGMAALGGIMPRPIPVQSDGTLKLDDIRNGIRTDNEHFPRTRLVSIENTQNMAGGQALSAEYTNAVAEIAQENGLKFHIDGARIFNAAAACGTDVKTLSEKADSLTFCLSKGLCAPAGSVLVGSREFIHEARRARKMLGGGLRQVGVLAAAGLIALHKMSKRLHEDHENAQRLADGLRQIPAVNVLGNATNFVFMELNPNAPLPAETLIQKLENDYNIIIRGYPGMKNRFRLVTHYWITPERVDTVIDAMKTLLS